MFYVKNEVTANFRRALNISEIPYIESNIFHKIFSLRGSAPRSASAPPSLARQNPSDNLPPPNPYNLSPTYHTTFFRIPYHSIKNSKTTKYRSDTGKYPTLAGYTLGPPQIVIPQRGQLVTCVCTLTLNTMIAISDHDR